MVFSFAVYNNLNENNSELIFHKQNCCFFFPEEYNFEYIYIWVNPYETVEELFLGGRGDLTF